MGDKVVNLIPASDVPHVSENIAEEMQARGWDADTLASLLMLKRFPDEWGKIRLELGLFFAVGPTTKKLLFKDDFAAELAGVFKVSPEFLTNMHAAWLERGVERKKETGQ